MTSTLCQCGGEKSSFNRKKPQAEQTSGKANLRRSKAQRRQPSASTGWTEAKETSEKMSEKKGKKSPNSPTLTSFLNDLKPSLTLLKSALSYYLLQLDTWKALREDCTHVSTRMPVKARLVRLCLTQSLDGFKNHFYSFGRSQNWPPDSCQREVAYFGFKIKYLMHENNSISVEIFQWVVRRLWLR